MLNRPSSSERPSLASGPRRHSGPSKPSKPKGPFRPLGPMKATETSLSVIIIQHNTNRQETATITVLEEGYQLAADIVLLQEPYCYRIRGAFIPVQHPSYNLIAPIGYTSYPSLPKRPRVLAYIRKEIGLEISPRFDLVSDPDLQAIEVQGPEPFLLLNLYNEKEVRGGQSSQQPSRQDREAYTVQRLLLGLQLQQPFLLAGDFNLHHPLWNPEADPSKAAMAEPLVQWLTRYKANLLTDLEAIGELGGTYYRKNLQGTSIIDLAFYSGFRQLEWGDWRYISPTGSDHEAISFTVRARAGSQTNSFTARPCLYNYKKADWEAFQKSLRNEETHLLNSLDRLISLRNLEGIAHLLTSALTKAAKLAIPRKRLCERSKPWWTGQLTDLRKGLAAAGRRYKGLPTDSNFEAFKAARNSYSHAIKTAKKTHWKDFLADAAGKDVFTAYAYTKARSNPILPAIRHKRGNSEAIATTFSDKCRAFLTTLFPAPQPQPQQQPQQPIGLSRPPEPPIANCYKPQNSAIQPQGYRSSKAKASANRWEWPALEEIEIRKAIFGSSNKKAPGPDAISFLPIQRAYAAVPTLFNRAYKALFSEGYHPKAWREAIGIIIPKLNKPDYSIPKAYRVIALLNCLGKVLERLFATRLSYLANTAGLLPQSQLGGRKQRSAVDTAMLLTHYIQQQQRTRKGAITSTLFLDIKGAFDNVSADRLLEVLKGLELPENLISWVSCFISCRKIQLAFEGQLQDLTDIAIGVPQGSPISPILFLLYVRDICAPSGLQLSYIDDFSISVTSTSARKNIKLLATIASSLFQQAAAQKVEFDSDKTELIHFSRQKMPITEGIQLGSIFIKPKQLVRWLGIWFDSKLTFKEHIQKKLAAAQAAYEGLARLATAQKGLSFRASRQLYVACVTSIADYGVQLWYRGPGQQRSLLKLYQRLQNQALLRITGAFKGAPYRALELEAAVPPPEVRFQKACLAYSLRTLYFLPDHPIRKAYGQPVQDELAGTQSDLGSLAYLKPTTQLFSLLVMLRKQVIGPSYRLERLKASWQPPWLQLPQASIAIAKVPKLEAKKQHRALLASLEFEDPLVFYTDGSQGTHKGALTNALGYCEIGLENRPRTAAYENLGPSVEVADAEVTAIYRVLQDLLKRPKPSKQQLTFIFIDSQAAISKLNGYSDLAIRIRGLLTQLGLYYLLKLQWCPGHVGIFGNDLADELAKKGLQETPKETPMVSISHLRRKARQATLGTWMGLWAEEGRKGPKAKGLGTSYRRVRQGRLRYLFRPDKTLAAANRPTFSAYIQLATGIGYLKSYLKRIGKSTTDGCRCGQAAHTATHLLLHCRRYKAARKKMKNALIGQPATELALFGTKAGREALLAYLVETGIGTSSWFEKE
jgi:ribonuclease HI